MPNSFEIGQLIINSPYEEPASYWAYDRKYWMFERKAGRRPAAYVVATPGSKAFEVGEHERVAVKIIDDRGIESLKIVEVA